MRPLTPLLLLLSSLVAASEDVPYPGDKGWVPFTDHCYNHELKDTRSSRGRPMWLLQGTCDVNGEQKPYKINPGTCIGNDHGRLKWWVAGNYWQSCKGCRLTETHGDLYFSCTCTDDLFGSSTINLSEKIAWHDQGIKCFMEGIGLDDQAWMVGED